MSQKIELHLVINEQEFRIAKILLMVRDNACGTSVPILRMSEHDSMESVF